jgi:hypothetical protein
MEIQLTQEELLQILSEKYNVKLVEMQPVGQMSLDGEAGPDFYAFTDTDFSKYD